MNLCIYAYPFIVQNITNIRSLLNIKTKKYDQGTAACDALRKEEWFTEAIKTAGIGPEKIELVPINDPDRTAFSYGNKSLPGKAELLINPEFLNKPIMNFEIALAIGQVKNNTTLILFTVQAITLLAMTLLLMYTLPYTLPCAVLSAALTMKTNELVSRFVFHYLHEKNFSFATAESPTEDLNALKGSLSSQLEERTEKQKHKPLIYKLLTTSTGESIFLPSRFSLQSKINCITKELNDRELR